MDIKSDIRPLRANVRFDSYEERQTFGSRSPLWTTSEGLRYAGHIARRTPQGALVLRVLGEYPLEYPQNEIIKHSLLAKVAGNIVLAKTYHTGDKEIESGMLATITEYFESQKPT
jgi:hypothetical protein